MSASKMVALSFSAKIVTTDAERNDTSREDTSR